MNHELEGKEKQVYESAIIVIGCVILAGLLMFIAAVWWHVCNY